MPNLPPAAVLNTLSGSVTEMYTEHQWEQPDTSEPAATLSETTKLAKALPDSSQLSAAEALPSAPPSQVIQQGISAFALYFVTEGKSRSEPPAEQPQPQKSMLLVEVPKTMVAMVKPCC